MKEIRLSYDEYKKMEDGFQSEINELKNKKYELHELIRKNVFLKGRNECFNYLTDPGFDICKAVISNVIKSNKGDISQAKQEFIDIFERELAMIEREFNKLKSESRKNMTFWQRFKFLFTNKTTD